MFVRIHSPKNYGNAGTCAAIVEYLEKENEQNEDQQNYLFNRQMFFDQTSDNIASSTVILKTDRNKAKLSKDEAKFYMLSINPSQEEMRHMAYSITGRKVNSLDEFTLAEKRIFEAQLRAYTREVMDLYARNFNKKVELSGKDLLYHGKVEHERKYSRFDEKVKNGQRKEGQLKEGFQSHVHVVVSRKDLSNTIKLSPFTNHRSSKNTLNGKSVPMGFNRKEFVEKCEHQFDQQFSFNRALIHSFEYRYSMKNLAAQLARNMGRQIAARTIPGFNLASRAIMLGGALKSEDKLRQFSTLLMQNKHSAQLMRAIQASYRPEKLAIEVAKKTTRYLKNGSTLTI